MITQLFDEARLPSPSCASAQRVTNSFCIGAPSRYSSGQRSIHSWQRKMFRKRQSDWSGLLDEAQSKLTVAAFACGDAVLWNHAENRLLRGRETDLASG